MAFGAGEPLELSEGRISVDVFHSLLTGALEMTSLRLDGLTLPFALRGPLDNPRVTFNDAALQDAILAGAQAELSAAVDEKTAEAQQKLDELIGLYGDDVSWQVARVYAVWGDKDQTLAALNHDH